MPVHPRRRHRAQPRRPAPRPPRPRPLPRPSPARPPLPLTRARPSSRRIRPKRSSRASRPNAEISFWTFYLSPTFDQYIKDTIARFEATYPGVKVKWEDHQATFQADLNNAFAANIAPDVINLSVSEGWVSDYATKGQLLGLNSTVPKAVQDIYFPGLWNEQLVKGENFQFPWYQGLNVELINKKIYEEGAGLNVADFPKKIEELPALCKTIKDKTETLCDIRLTVNDLLSQMVYEGNVDVINDAGTAFTFDSQAGVDWLQMYVDMVAAGTVDNTVLTTKDDRVGLLLFSAGQAAFYATGPNLVRDVKSNNATLYDNLAMQPSPVGKSGVLGKGLMSISVNKSTKFPNASIALAQFFTNPRSMVQFSQAGRGLPVVPFRLRRSVLQRRPVGHRRQRPAPGEGHHLDLPGHRPDDPEEGRRQRGRPQGGRVGAVQQGSCEAGPDRRSRRGQQAHPVGPGSPSRQPPTNAGHPPGPFRRRPVPDPPQGRAGTFSREWR